MIREQKLERNNIFDATIRDRSEEWTARVWREVYNFLPGGGLANRTDKYVEGKFLHEVDPKDGFPVRECRDTRERRLLEFLVPIVHPDKPTQVTRTLGNTIFGAISGERSVDWAVIFMELVNRFVGGASKTKPTPICPFLYHLYESKGLLTEEEETDYKVAQELHRYRITLDRDPESDSEVLQIAGPEPQRIVAPVNQVKREIGGSKHTGHRMGPHLSGQEGREANPTRVANNQRERDQAALDQAALHRKDHNRSPDRILSKRNNRNKRRRPGSGNRSTQSSRATR